MRIEGSHYCIPPPDDSGGGRHRRPLAAVLYVEYADAKRTVWRSAVEGAPNSTQRQSNSRRARRRRPDRVLATITTRRVRRPLHPRFAPLRGAPVVPPRPPATIAGGGRCTSDRILAAPFAPEFCSKNKSHCCFASKQIKGGGAPEGANEIGRTTRTDVTTCPRFGRGARHGRSACANRPLRARSPFGAPPRLWPWFLGLGFSTSGQVSWDAAVCGRYPRLPVPVQRLHPAHRP